MWTLLLMPEQLSERIVPLMMMVVVSSHQWLLDGISGK
jgi:hypothetical protein